MKNKVLLKIIILLFFACFMNKGWADAPAVIKQGGPLNVYNNILYSNIIPEANQTAGVVSNATIGNTNLQADPSFTSSTNYSILGTSTAINGGVNSYNALSTDISGNGRFYGIIDVGAFEIVLPPTLSITGTVATITYASPGCLVGTLTLSGATIAAYTGTDGTYPVSSTVYPQNELPAWAFKNRTGLTSMAIPSSVTSISNLELHQDGSVASPGHMVTYPKTLMETAV